MNAGTLPSSKLIELARETVPRYTSYPTAPHFSATIGAEAHARWLSNASARGPISLYLHIPFCRTICHYCGCTTKASRSDDPIRDYAQVLRAEIALLAEKMGRAEVSHIHWGGGTPNLLPPDCFEQIVGDLTRAFRFRQDMEHAIELDPRHVTKEGALHLARMGINRASLGVQDLDEKVQIAIGRHQPLSIVEQAVDALRGSGIHSLNFDLMYGLPLQTGDSILDSTKKALELKPSRIALFGYAHVPWMKSHQKLIDASTLPDATARISLARIAREVIRKTGFEEIGIDHFALPDDELCRALTARRLRRNFQGYTTDRAETLIGLGASSISRTRYGYAQNAADNAGWTRAVAAGSLPVVRGKAFEGEDLLRARVIEDLLCYFDADLDRLCAEHGVGADVFDENLAALKPLAEEGWVVVKGKRVIVHCFQHEIARVVASRFDTYIGRAGRHSVAV